MAKNATFSLKLLIDNKRNRVVLAEADQDFVDVLISLLSLPMGKIAKLLENHKMVLGCFKNLNKSVKDMGINHFQTEACKSMLLNPKSAKGIHCKRLKLNLNMTYTDDTILYMCASCKNAYTSFNTSRCRCGSFMNSEVYVAEEEQVGEEIRDMVDGVFVNSRSLFIVTDDLKVTESSIHGIMQVLNNQGYLGLTDLRETRLDVGIEEVLTLLGCLFTSETPLTSAFLQKHINTKMNKMLSPLVEKARGSIEPDGLYSVKVYVKKFDREILYVECNEDFIDSLISFLVLPLELAYSLSNDNTALKCVGNLCRTQCRKASASNFYQIPDFYICNNNEPLKLSIHSSLVYECHIPDPKRYSCRTIARKIDKSLLSSRGGRIVNFGPNDPKVNPRTSSDGGNGFMKGNMKFIVSNDLVISPMKSTSFIDFVLKLPLGISDIEEHQILISKTELISILRASLISSSALTNGLSNFLTKKIKAET